MSTSSPLASWCPVAPDWRVPWATIEAHLEGLSALYACPQDPEYHAEGDVGTHTKLACDALAGCEEFRRLPESARRVVFAGVLLHDWGKVACTRTDTNGRLTSRGHSARGEILTRQLLWQLGVPFLEREQVAALVRYHQVPFFLVDRSDAERLAITVSQTVRCDWLAQVAWADGAGRRCAEPRAQARILDNVALFRELCAEWQLLTRPWPFQSAHSRFLYFRREGRDPRYHAHDDTRCEVILLSGLPAAGKDHWVEAHAGDRPVISLDQLRAAMRVEPDAPQNAVVAAARERARDFLRQGQSFVWNATNLSRSLRGELVSLFADYHARVRIVYLEVPPSQLTARNRARVGRVPQAVIDRLLDRWTVPDLTEAHWVECPQIESETELETAGR